MVQPMHNIRVFLLFTLLGLWGCQDDTALVQGYVEGDFLHVGLPLAGRITQMRVQRGDRVQAGDELFSLDDQAEQAGVAEAKARLEQARFQRDNLLTGKRAQEIRALEAQRAQAQAAQTLSAIQLKRQADLFAQGFASQSALDAARSTAQRDQAHAQESAANLDYARQGARTAEISAADAAVDAAQAALGQAQWRLDQRRAMAAKAASVEDVLFHVGEDVAPGQPVISLLPPDQVLLRFYLNPPQVARLKTAAQVDVNCSGCAPGLKARITFVAQQATYAPPVIYSRDHADTLVFLVEARPLDPSGPWHPGQPVTITLPP